MAHATHSHNGLGDRPANEGLCRLLHLAKHERRDLGRVQDARRAIDDDLDARLAANADHLEGERGRVALHVRVVE
jgi:hypothetical protein